MASGGTDSELGSVRFELYHVRPAHVVENLASLPTTA